MGKHWLILEAHYKLLTLGLPASLASLAPTQSGLDQTRFHAQIDYDQAAPTYFRSYSDMMDAHANMVQFANLKPEQTVLDVACGTGVVGILASQKLGSWKNVYFTDRSKGMRQEVISAVHTIVPAMDLKDLRAHVSSWDADFTVAKDRLTIKEQFGQPQKFFDVVFASQILNHYPDSLQPQVVAALLDLVKPTEYVVLDMDVPCPSRHINGEGCTITAAWRETTIRINGPQSLSVATGPKQYGRFDSFVGPAEIALATSRLQGIVETSRGSDRQSGDIRPLWIESSIQRGLDEGNHAPGARDNDGKGRFGP